MAIILLRLLLSTTWGATRSLDTQTTAGWTVKAEPWGKNSLRVRARLNGAIDLDRPGALLPPSSDNKGAPRRLPLHSEVHVGADTITNGNLVATLGADGLFTFTRHSDGAVVLNETARTILLHRRRRGLLVLVLLPCMLSSSRRRQRSAAKAGSRARWM